MELSTSRACGICGNPSARKGQYLHGFCHRFDRVRVWVSIVAFAGVFCVQFIEGTEDFHNELV